VCGGAFTGLEKIISARGRSTSIGFGAKVAAPEDRKAGEVFREVEPEDHKDYRGEGTEAFDKDFPSTAGRNIGGPDPFRGMPKRGGSSVPLSMKEVTGDSAMSDYLSMFPQARGIGLDPNALLPRSHPLTPSSVRSVARTNRAASGMAMDSSGDDSYDRMFPGVRGRIGLL
jgi:hypothetical protein